MTKVEREKLERRFHSKIRVYQSQATGRGAAIYAQGFYHHDDGTFPPEKYGFVGMEKDLVDE